MLKQNNVTKNLFFCGGNQTQGLIYAKQVFLPLSYSLISHQESYTQASGLLRKNANWALWYTPIIPAL